MYSRRQGETTYSFEPSGGLFYSSLVMMDRETDSHWSIITESAIWGPEKGRRLEPIPGAVRATWGEWRAAHPETRVLSINGTEHIDRDPYVRYYDSDKGFGDLTATDARFADKALVYAFHWQGNAYAVPHQSFIGGNVVQLGDRQLFLYRAEGDPNYRSTSAFLAEPGGRFARRADGWRVEPQGLALDPSTRRFGDREVERFPGFDTYWYIWSNASGGSEVLEPS